MKNKDELVGRRMRGFRFKSGKYNGLYYNEHMDDFIGKEGVITEIYKIEQQARVNFGSEHWLYPLELIEPHLVEAETSKREPLTTLPSKWCIQVTEENMEMLGAWRTDGPLVGYRYPYKSQKDKWYLHTPMHGKNGFNRSGRDADYTEITDEEFRRLVLKSNDSPVPAKWCIKVTTENHQQVGEWFDEHMRPETDYNGSYTKTLWIGDYFHFPKHQKYSCTSVKPAKGYTEIDFEFFKQHILTQKQNTMKTTISRTDLARIHSIACATWKTYIEDYAKRSIFSDHIELTADQVNQMFDAATADQRPVLVEIFGEPVKELDFRSEDIRSKVDGIAIFGAASMPTSQAFIGLPRVEDSKNTFFLNPAYEWKIDKSNHLVCSRP